ncbi:Pycsar system effector family protein [Saccharopolyspora shandongensis]|uniref:Pycsar system effector family protein n=1 Tax=Saccharopolyspora shandongensis TaxID=418495 RepID=UPI0033E08111
MALALRLKHRRLDAMTATEDAWKALQHTNDLIKIADTKAAAMLAADGVLVGILVRALPAQQLWLADWLHVGLLLISIGSVGASILFALGVFVPRLDDETSHSILFFNNIARQYPKAADFVPTYQTTLGDATRLEESLAEQIWATSRVTRRKFRNAAPAIWLFGFALITALLASVTKS